LEWKTEKYFGRNTVQQIEHYYGFINDPILTDYINRVGKKLSDNSDRTDIPYEFYIINSEETNAFAAPGGFVFVTKGLLEKTETEEELAGVMGHEVGHIAAKHGAKRIKKLPFLIAGMTILDSKTSETVSRMAGIALSLMQLHYSREDEYQADNLGAKYSYKSGYDPSGMISFFKKLEKENPSEGFGKLEVAISSHPKTVSRMEAIKRTPEMAPTYENYLYLAENYYKRIYYHESVEYYKKAILLNPDSIEAMNGLGAALFAMCDYSESKKYYSKVLSIDKVNKNAIDGLASINKRREDIMQKTEVENDNNPEDIKMVLSLMQNPISELEKRNSYFNDKKSRIKSSVDELRSNLYHDLPSMRETAKEIDENDYYGVKTLNYASAYFEGFSIALDDNAHTEEIIRNSFNDYTHVLREMDFRLRKISNPGRNTLQAADEAVLLSEEFIRNSNDTMNTLKGNLKRIEKGYARSKSIMNSLDDYLFSNDEPVNSFDGDRMIKQFEDQIDIINEVFEGNENINDKMNSERAGLQRAYLNFNTSIISDRERKIFKDMLVRRFNVPAKEINYLVKKGYGFGDALILINFSKAYSVDLRKFENEYDNRKETIDEFLLRKFPEANISGSFVLLKLAESELKMLTRNRQLVKMDFDYDIDIEDIKNQYADQLDEQLITAIEEYGKGEYELAIEAINERGRDKPATELSHILLGMVLVKQNEHEAALNEFKYSEKKNSRYSMIHYLLGNTFSDMDRFDDANNEYHNALKYDENNKEALAGLGYTYSMMGETESAEKYFKKSIDNGSRSALVRLNIGLLYYQKGYFEDAMTYFKESLMIDPEQPLLKEMVDRLNS